MYDFAAIAILLGVFFGMILLKLPITVSLLFSTGVTLLYIDIPLMTMVQPSSFSISAQIRRQATSAPPPAPQGTIISTVLPA